VDARDLAQWRLASHGLAPSTWSTTGEVIAAMTASQAQDLLPGRWSLARRCTPMGTDEEATTALDDGRVVRTHVLRPTWHTVNPLDLLWLLAATSPRVHRLNAGAYRRLGIDDVTMTRVRSILERALRGRSATRAELAATLFGAGVEAPPPRVTYLLMYAELEGWICSGRSQGKQQTYALVADRIPDATWPDSREEALAWLAGRYFATRGPATMKDFAGWASLTTTEARTAVEAGAAELEQLEVEGRRYLVAPGTPPPGGAPPHLMLAQAYDELVMSYFESRDVLTSGWQLWDLPARRFMHPLLIDGRLVGHWRYDRDRTGRPCAVRTSLLRELDRDEREAMDAEVSRFAVFVGGDVEWG
jgi:hypothetical protein